MAPAGTLEPREVGQLGWAPVGMVDQKLVSISTLRVCVEIALKLYSSGSRVGVYVDTQNFPNLNLVR